MDPTQSSTGLTASLKADIQKEAMKAWTQAIEQSLKHLILAGISPNDISYRYAHVFDDPCVCILVKGQAVIKHTLKFTVSVDG